MLIKEFIKGAKGSHYLIADAGTTDTLKDIRVHSKRVPMFVLPDSHIQQLTQNMEPCRNHLSCRVDSARKKMRPGMMVVEMADSEQHIYLPHDTRFKLPNLQPTMLGGKPRKIMINQYCRGGLLQRCLILGKGQGESTATCQARGSTEAIWIRCHLPILHMCLQW